MELNWMSDRIWRKADTCATVAPDVEDDSELLEIDADYFDHRKCAWALRRLQELRGVPDLRVSLDPAPMPREGWLLMMRLPLSVRFPTLEASLLIARLVERRNAAVGIWRPSDEEILAYACALPGAQPVGCTEEVLKRSKLWRPKHLLRIEEMMTMQDRRNIQPRKLAA